MAEILGTAASVIQVAEAGFSLATTLYNYAKSVKSAEKEIKKIARDVKLTAKVLQRTPEQLQNDQDAQTCTEEAIHDLEDVLDGCKEAFQEVDDALTKSMKTGPDGKTTISMAEKLKWPLRSNKLEVLRANLEKLKTTLLLMLSVLAYGSKMSQSRNGTAEVKVELTLDKLQIQNLVQAEDEATQRYEELSKAFSRLETRINESARSASSSNGPEMFSKELANGSTSASMLGTNTTAMFTIAGSNMQPVEPRTEDRRTSDMVYSEHAVYTGLGLCASAVSRLATSIDAATKKWQKDQVFEHYAILNSFQSTAQAIKALMFQSRAPSARPTNAGPQPSPSTAPQNPAHQDYQLQLALLEEQNKKRLLTARTTQDSAASRDEELFQSSPNMASGQAMAIDASRSSTNAESQVFSPRSNQLADASGSCAQYNPANRPIAPRDEPDMIGGAPQGPPQASCLPQALLQQYGELQQLEQAVQQQAYSPPQALLQRLQQALPQQQQQHASQQQAQQHHYAWRSPPANYLSGLPGGMLQQGQQMQSMPSGTAGSATYGSSQDQDALESAESSSKTNPARKRTKSGCLTCRKQRIKCDEQRPVCSNCVKKKRHCEGYLQRVVYKPPIYFDQANMQPCGTSEQYVERRDSYEATTGRTPSTLVPIKSSSPDVEVDDAAEEDQSDSDGEDDVVHDLLRRWTNVEHIHKDRDLTTHPRMLEEDADKYAQARLPDVDMGL